MKKNTILLTGMALSAMLVIFGVLILAVFSLLSVSSARAQQRLGEKTREPICEYYEAEAQAQEILARLRSGEIPQGVEEKGGVYRYQCPVGEDQHLAVEAAVQGGNYQILRWQVCQNSPWEADDTLPVWEGKKE